MALSIPSESCILVHLHHIIVLIQNNWRITFFVYETSQLSFESLHILCTSHTDPYLIHIFISNLKVLENCIDLVASTVYNYGNSGYSLLLEHLITSGGDVFLQLMVPVNCLHLPRGLQSDQQTMQVVFYAKLTTCASHKAALSSHQVCSHIKI